MLLERALPTAAYFPSFTVTFGLLAVLLASKLGRHARVRQAVRCLTVAALLLISAVSSVEAASITLVWDPNKEVTVTGYIVSWGTASGVYGYSANVGNQTSFQFTPPDPSQSYFLAVRAYDAAGMFSTYSQEVSIAPSGASTLPSAVTGAASGVGSVAAILNGTANSNGTFANGYFQYGVSTSYGSTTPLVSIGLGTVNVAISGSIAGLTCNTVYHFRAAAGNVTGTAFGSDAAFTTGACAVGSPTVTTGAASAISTTAATLNGTANPNGLAATGVFQYGLTTAYGGTTSAVSLGSGTLAVSISGGSLTGLTCNTVYHFRAAASNSAGTVAGADKTFTTAACTTKVPVVTTGSASGVGASVATLNGTVNPNGSATTGSFQYGLTTSYGSMTPTVNLGSSADAAVFAIGSGGLTGLACNTVYHFRAVATNTAGTSYGADASFTTAACAAKPPTVTTGAASGVSATGATVTGSANPNGSATTGNFQYGLTTAYGAATPAVSLGSSADAAVMPIWNGSLTGLTCNTVYHYRAMATNSGGTSYGADASFTTAACAAKPPTVTTGSASAISASTVTLTSSEILTGSANPNGSATTGNFQYGLSAAYGGTTPAVSLGSGTLLMPIGNGGLTGLSCNTVYHFRAVATNSGGTSYGADATFATAACAAKAPTVTTGAASNVSASSATLTGAANPNGSATTGDFQYGLTTAYGSATPAVSLGSSGDAAMIPIGSGTLTGLSCNTVYHYRAVATNSGGMGVGADGTFTTAACAASKPTVVTAAASNVSKASATLNGVVSPNGAATTAYFQYGGTTAYGKTTSGVSLAAVGSASNIGAGLTGLSCNTVYHFRAVATSSAGMAAGVDVVFQTASCKGKK